MDGALRELVGTRWRGDVGTAATVVSAVLGPVLFGLGLLATALGLRRLGDARHAGVVLRVAVLVVACRLTSVIAKLCSGGNAPAGTTASATRAGTWSR